MAYKEVTIGQDMYQFELNHPLEGVMEEVREDIGKHKSTVYKVSGKSFWGTSELDILLEKVRIGNRVRITLVDENYKFPSGRIGRHFKVEIDQ